ncbi:hypothetical protein CHARACLAT_011632 [Characodon lateralis]|uniref:Uncharacterized protein n=1 Tax=Characodon lateralis TaxID=208331 RepID=A0ABU7D6L8_9TELE|nr:hypothetical protein [Characodon lateralis]
MTRIHSASVRVRCIYFKLIRKCAKKRCQHIKNAASEAMEQTLKLSVRCVTGQELYPRSGVTFGTEGGRKRGDCKEEWKIQGGVTSV